MVQSKLEAALLKQLPKSRLTPIDNQWLQNVRLQVAEVESRAEQLRENSVQLQEKRLQQVKTLRAPINPLIDVAVKYGRLHPIENMKVCPSCGNTLVNTKNRKPWCFKCDTLMVSPKDVEKWMRNKVKVSRDKYGTS